jgi:L-amino acid N-acyltransferase YncA
MAPVIRLADAADLPEINAIYNHYVLHSTCTYQVTPSSPEERQAWFEHHTPRHPATVAVSGTGGILGWASLSPFHNRLGWRFTVEDSVYVHPDHLRQGLGRALLADILARADQLGYRSVVAIISADQEPSLALHQQFGFAPAGHLRHAGYKFERWLDVIYLQRQNPAFPVTGATMPSLWAGSP